MKRISQTWKQQRVRQSTTKCSNSGQNEKTATVETSSLRRSYRNDSTDGEWLTASSSRKKLKLAYSKKGEEGLSYNSRDGDSSQRKLLKESKGDRQEGPGPSRYLHEGRLQLRDQSDNSLGKGMETNAHSPWRKIMTPGIGNFASLGQQFTSTPVGQSKNSQAIIEEWLLHKNNTDTLKKPGFKFERLHQHVKLEDWSLPSPVLVKYKEVGITKMFPWQAECLLTGNALRGGNLVFSAPTSAGKTLVAEILMLKRLLEEHKKAIYILPFVSVAKEKAYYLQSLYEEIGIRVEGFVGSRAPPGGFAATDVAVCTIEKANSLVNRLIQEKRLSELGCVIVDEMHMIGDHGRGYLLELLLSKVTYLTSNPGSQGGETIDSGFQIQIIGMSATLPNLSMLASWLKADLYVTDFRPVPLTEMIKVGRTLIDINSSVVGEIKQEDVVVGDEHYLVPLCKETLSEGNSVLVFCPTKAWCENLAETLAGLIGDGLQKRVSVLHGGKEVQDSFLSLFDKEACAEVLQQLRATPVGLDAVLAKVVPKGIAFHHAGLTFDEREIIEGGFRSGAIKVLTATSTLSSGVNLPARRVIIRTPIFHGKTIDALVYKQMSGRAGRKGKDVKGESILICKETEKQKGISLLTSDLKPVFSCLMGSQGKKGLSSMKRALLEVIGGGIATTLPKIQLYASCTYLQTCIASKEECSPDAAFRSTISFLIDNEFIAARFEAGSNKAGQETDTKIYFPTQLGKATLASALSPDEALVVFGELQSARRCFVLENELHIIYQVTPIHLQDQWPDLDWYNYLTLWERLPAQFKRVGELVGVRESFLARSVRGRAPMRTAEQLRTAAIHKRFYAALVLQDLVNEVAILNVCNKYGISKGQVQSLQTSAATFAGMITVFCQKLGWLNLELILHQFQSRLSFGISRELCDLVRISLLNGARARLLYNAGYNTVSAVACADVSELGALLISAAPFESKKEHAGNEKKELLGRRKIRSIWVTGREGLTEMEAAELIVSDAKKILQKDIREMGVAVDTIIPAGTVHSQTNVHPIPQASVSNLSQNIDRKQGHGLPTDALDSLERLHMKRKPIPVDHDNPLVFNAEKRSKGSTLREETGMTRIVSCLPKRQKRVMIEKELLEVHEVNDDKVETSNVQIGTGRAHLETTLEEPKLKCDKDTVPPDKSFNVLMNVSSLVWDTTVLTETIVSKSRLGLSVCENLESPLNSRADHVQRDRSQDFMHKAGKIDPLNSESEKPQSPDASNSSSISVNLYSPETLSSFDAFKARRAKCSCSASDIDFDESMSILQDQPARESLAVKHDSTPELYPPSPVKVVNDDLVRVISRESLIEGQKETDIDPCHLDGASPSNVESPSNISADESEGLTLFLSDSEAEDPCSKGSESADRREKSNSGVHCHVNVPSSLLHQPQSCSNRRKSSKVDLISWEFDSLEPMIDQLQSQLNRGVREEEMTMLNSPVASGRVDIPVSVSNNDRLLVTNESCASKSNNKTKDISRRHSAIFSSSTSLAENDFVVIDVTAHPDLFVTFVEEWRSQDSYAIAVACEGNPKETYKIGGKLLGEDVPKGKRGISLYDGALEVVGLGVSWEARDAYYINLKEETLSHDGKTCTEGPSLPASQVHPELSLDRRLDSIRSVASKNSACTVAFDMKGHYKLLRLLVGVFLKGTIKDPHVAAWLLDPEEKVRGVHTLTRQFLGPKDTALLEGIGILPENCAPGLALQASTSGQVRACVEAVLSQRLMKVLDERIASDDLTSAFLSIEMPVVRTLAALELTGIGFSVKECESLKSILKAQLSALEEKCYSLAGRTFSLSSPEEVARVLYIDLKLPYEGKTDKERLLKLGPRALGRRLRHLSTAKPALDKIRDLHPLPDVILEWRRVNNALIKVVFPLFRERKYCETLQMYRIYPESQTHTSTGRIAFREPNLQNVPRDFDIELPEAQSGHPSLKLTENKLPLVCHSTKSSYSISMRTAFIPAKGKVLLAADYSQMELRIIAHLAQDRKLIQILNNKGDVFRMIAGELFGTNPNQVADKERQTAKHICYGMIYGIGAKALGQQLSLSEQEAHQYMNRFMGQFLGIRHFIKKTVEGARSTGYIQTVMKRRRYLVAINSSNAHARSHAERQAVNTTVQGSAADIAKLAMVNIGNAFEVKFGGFVSNECGSYYLRPVNLVLQLHDEFLFEVDEIILPTAAQIVKHEMETAYKLEVDMPVRIAAGESWGSLRPYTIDI